jgi:hypothetical protein
MKFKTIAVMALMALGLCMPVKAQNDPTMPAMTKQASMYISKEGCIRSS